MSMNSGRLTAAVAQASGMISVQASCTVDEALVLIEARARSSRTTTEAVAVSVLGGEISFGD